MWDWIIDIFGWLLFDLLFFWRRDEDPSGAACCLQVIAILCVLAGIAGLVYWLWLR